MLRCACVPPPLYDCFDQIHRRLRQPHGGQRAACASVGTHGAAGSQRTRRLALARGWQLLNVFLGRRSGLPAAQELRKAPPGTTQLASCQATAAVPRRGLPATLRK